MSGDPGVPTTDGENIPLKASINATQGEEIRRNGSAMPSAPSRSAEGTAQPKKRKRTQEAPQLPAPRPDGSDSRSQPSRSRGAEHGLKRIIIRGDEEAAFMDGIMRTMDRCAERQEHAEHGAANHAVRERGAAKSTKSESGEARRASGDGKSKPAIERAEDSEPEITIVK